MSRFWFFLCFFLCPALLFAQDKLTLQQCIEYGIANNLQVRQYDLQILQKKDELRQKTFSLLPSLYGNATQGYSFGNSLDLTSYQYKRQEINSSYFSLNSNLTLFSGFSLLNNIRQSRFGYYSSQAAWQDMRDQISLEIASIYLEILMNTEQLKSATEQVELSKKLLAQTRLMVQVGDLNKVKELELQSQVANDEVNRVDAENQLELSYLKLKQYLNWDLTKALEIAGVVVDSTMFPDYSGLKVNDFLEESVNRLPKVKKAQFDLQSSKFGYLSALGQGSPQLTLQSGLNTRYSSAATDIHNQKISFNQQMNNNFAQTFSFGLNIPLFNNLQNTFNIQLARINMNNNALNLEITKNNSRNDIYQAYELLMSSNKKYIAAVNNLKAQKLLFEQNNMMYDQGLISFYDWQSAKNALFKAETSYLSAKYDFLYKIKVLDYYRGIPIKL